MKCSPLTAMFVSAVLAGLANMDEDRKEEGYPETGKDDGTVSEKAWHETNANQQRAYAKMAGETMAAPAATMSEAHPGPSWQDYQRERDHDRRFARQRALEIASDVVRSGDGVESEVLPMADRFYGFIIDGATPTQTVNLGAVSTEQLVAELNVRIVSHGA